MAEGGGDPLGAESSAGVHLHEESDLILFLRSPTWLYPITRFLGHALNYYHYDIDFLSCDRQMEERNTVLYDSYRDLIGSLLGNYCRAYHIKPSVFINEILDICDEPQRCGTDSLNLHSFNFIRATYRLPYFGYMIMCYCSLFKVKCCEDVIEEMHQMRIDISERNNWRGLLKYVYEEMIVIAKRQDEIDKSFKDYTGLMVQEMQYGPFVYAFGVKLHDKTLNYDLQLDQITKIMTNLKDMKEILKAAKTEPDKKAESVPTLEPAETSEDVVTAGQDVVTASETLVTGDITTVLRTVELKDSPQSSEDESPELNDLKAEAQEKLKQTIIESPASSALFTVSQRLALFTYTFKDFEPHYCTSPHYYTAPTSPVPIDPTLAPKEPISEPTTPKEKRSSKSPESQYTTAASSEETRPIQEPVTNVTKSRKKRSSKSASPKPQPISEPTTPKEKRSSKSPESQYITAASSEETRPIHVQEPVTKSRKKRSSKSASPKPDTPSSKVWHGTPPSSPLSTVLEPRAFSESPQTRRVKATMKLKRTPSPRLRTTPRSSRGSPPLPTNEQRRREYLLKAYETRNTYQIGFLGATFELKNATGYKKGLRDLITKQKWFEKEWPSPEHETKASDKAKVNVEDSTYGTVIEKKELKMYDDVYHGLALLQAVWKTYHDKHKTAS